MRADSKVIEVAEIEDMVLHIKKLLPNWKHSGWRKLSIFLTLLSLQVCVLFVFWAYLDQPRNLPLRETASFKKELHRWGIRPNKDANYAKLLSIGESFILKSEGKPTFDWQNLPNKMSQLNLNPVYAKFGIPRMKFRPKVNLLLIVSSAPKRIDRRMRIRETWWNDSRIDSNVTVKCLFMTDFPDTSTYIGQNIIEENIKFKDMAFQKLGGGIEFGKRFLYHMIWALQNYDFDYFMRMDDDYFLCLERFTKELPMPMRRMYHWGYVHCVAGIVRPEESIILFSRDLHERLLDQDPARIKSHPWADQMIGTWMNELNIKDIYNHDPRLHHTPVLTHIRAIESTFKDVCTNYIGVHGCYPQFTPLLWSLKTDKKLEKKELGAFSKKCQHGQVFNWTEFSDFWKYEPKSFIMDPVWNTSKQDSGKKVFAGRESGQG